jgi:arylsulfatase A-like enzyme
VVSFLAAHPPLIPPEFYMNRYLEMDLPEPIIGDWENEPPESWRTGGAGGQDVNLTGEEIRACRAGYYGLINHVDDQLRRILNPVQGIDRMTDGNTAVMFTSDHGEMLGDHYRYHKIMPYEPAARIPLLMRAPRRFGIEAGTVRDEAVCLEDVMPTVLDMADVEIPDTVEGRSLLSLAREEDSEWREFLPIEHSPRHQSLTDGREKFIWFTQDGREQFFHLAEDPEERHDLIDHPDWQDRIDLWRQRLIEHLADRPEGFSDGEKLIPGQRHSALLPGCDSNVVD